jgi:hypothetical protein
MDLGRRPTVLATTAARSRVLAAALVCWVLLLVAASAQVPVSGWHPVCVGVGYGRLEVEEPRPLRFHFLRIDLRAPGLSFLATPPGDDLSAHTTGLTTSAFVRAHRLQAAINAAPFSPIHKEEGKPVRVVGLTVSRGRVVSPATELPALVVTRRNEARIVEAPFDLRGVYTAVAGFSVVLRGGVVVGRSDQLHPRTAAGISADGRTLLLMVVDGRQPGYSEGLSSYEIGAWLRAAGASDGINLDGGGTSTMVLEDPDREPRIMNLPIHDGYAGKERVAGSHLGIRARRLRGGPQLPVP